MEQLLSVMSNSTFVRQRKFLCRTLEKSNTLDECVIKLLFQV